MVGARGLGRPDVKVFNVVLALDEVQAAPWQRATQTRLYPPAPGNGVFGEEALPVQARDSARRFRSSSVIRS